MSIKMITAMVLVYICHLSMALPFNGTSKVTCPPGTVNQGWTVVKSHSFDDAFKCCDHAVKGWKAVGEFEAPYVETGCLMSYNIQDTSVRRFLYPSSCQDDSDCGQKSFYGRAMTCCLDKKAGDKDGQGFCAALRHDGTDRCKQAKEVADWVNNGDDDQVDFETFAASCKAKGDHKVCLSCSQECDAGSSQGRFHLSNSVHDLLL